MKQRHLLSLKDLSAAELDEIFELAARVKANPEAYSQALAGRTLAMIFSRFSTRTRVSFEVAMFQLGGQAIFLGPDQMQVKSGQALADTLRLLAGYVDGVVARLDSHQDLLDLAKHSPIPIINGLSEVVHPSQALADFFTLRERKGKLAGLKLAYVGEGNNVCHALLLGAVKLGVAISVACPQAYQPNELIVKSAARDAQKAGFPVPVVTSDPRAAVSGADAVYTEVWTSVGKEGEAAARRQAFQSYSVSSEMMTFARPDAVFMHCLPAHRGEEVSAEVIDGAQSVVLAQSANRLPTQKAVLMLLLGGA